jgi:hypothetical protein
MGIKVLLSVLAAEALVAGAAFAQETGKDFHIAGTVINSQTGEPVRHALVSVRPMRAFRGSARGDQIPAPPAPVLTDLAGPFRSVDWLRADTRSRHKSRGSPRIELTSEPLNWALPATMPRCGFGRWLSLPAP